MVKISCLFLLVLIAFSCESKKKGKKKSSSGYVPPWLRTPPPKPTPTTGLSYKVGCTIKFHCLQFAVMTYCLLVLIRPENQT